MRESTIRSYVRRKHRMTPGQARALEEYWPQYGLNVESGWVNCSGECMLEIGFGMGYSLLAMAARHPEKSFIGIEVHRPGIGALLLAAAKQGITNIRVFNEDAVIVLKQCITDKSLSKIQIFFPDPWPKKRHKKRRLIQSDFVTLLQQKLKPGGQLHLATDCADYAQQMLAIVEATPGFENCAGTGQYLSEQNQRPMTKFERRALDEGRIIWDLLFTLLY
jgi:tRNA (guanine-N7-)-methyltransferase